MSETQNAVERTVAPVLRGLTWDGNVGAVVVTAGAIDSLVEESNTASADVPEITVGAPADTGDSDAWIRVLAEGVGSLRERVRETPLRVTLESGERFGVAADFDSAVAALRGYAVGAGTTVGDDGERRGHVRAHAEEAASRAAMRAGWGASGAEQGAVRQADAGMSAGHMAGRVCVVTGGAQGFGEEIVRSLCSVGAYVAIADLNMERARALSEEFNTGLGRTATIPVEVDVSDEASVEAMVSTVTRTFGGMDLFVSNAGVLIAGSVKSLSYDDFRFVGSVNYDGFFLCTKAASPVMALQFRAQRAGEETAITEGYMSDIVQINSKSGLVGSNRNGAYAGSKFGAVGLVESFALELIEDGIKVNAICPGNFFDGPLWSDPEKGLFVQYLRAGKVPGAETIADVKRHYEQRVPMGRGCRGGDVARALFYIVEQRYETGQAVPVTGGQVMLH